MVRPAGMAPQFERRGAAQGSRALRQGEYRRGVRHRRRIGIRAIPTLVLFKAGAEVKRVSGVLDARSLVQWIETEGATASEAARSRRRCSSPRAVGKPAAPAAGVSTLETAAVEVRDVELTYSAEAVVEAVRQSTVSAQIAGRIVELRFDVGDYVKKGEVIVRIDERAAAQALAASEAQVRQAEAALRNARAEYERARQLVTQKFLSQAALDRAEAEYKAAQERVSALLAGAGRRRPSAASRPWSRPTAASSRRATSSWARWRPRASRS